MRKTLPALAGCFFLGVVLLGSGCGSPATKGTGAVSVGGHYSLQIEITPDDAHSNTILCRVRVRDLDTDRIVWEPQIRTVAGEQGRIAATDDERDRRLAVTVTFDPPTGRASYTAEIHEDGRLVLEHAADVQMKPEDGHTAEPGDS